MQNAVHSIKDLLEHRAKVEDIEILACDVCHSEGQAAQTSSRLCTDREIVMFRINRYTMGPNFMQEKRHDVIQPELRLLLDQVEYELVASVEQNGATVRSGHYQCVIRSDQGWERRNDGELIETRVPSCKMHEQAPTRKNYPEERSRRF